MRYIRSCPSCSMELRFPLDMGILIITCPSCNTAFRMDPNDPKTFQSGNFDLSPPKKKFPFHFPIFDRFMNYVNSAKDIRFLIPILLFVILLLNLIKIFNISEVEVKEKQMLDEQEFFQESEPDGIEPDYPDDRVNPSVEI